MTILFFCSLFFHFLIRTSSTMIWGYCTVTQLMTRSQWRLQRLLSSKSFFRYFESDAKGMLESQDSYEFCWNQGRAMLFYHCCSILLRSNPMFCRYNVAIKCATITPGTFDSYADEICTLNIIEIPFYVSLYISNCFNMWQMKLGLRSSIWSTCGRAQMAQLGTL